LLLVLLWPQPLFWLLRRRLRLDQETLADAAAAGVAGRIEYAQQLLAWSRDFGPRGRAPRLAGAMGLWEGPSQLKRRIAALLDEKLTVLRQASRKWSVGSACIALTAAALLSLVTLQRPDRSAYAQTPSAAPETATESTGAAETTRSTTGRAQVVQAAADGVVTNPPASGQEAAAPAADTTHTTAGPGQWVLVDKATGAEVPSAPGRIAAATTNTIDVRCLDDAGAAAPNVTVGLYRVQYRTGAHEFVRDVSTNSAGEAMFDNLLPAADVASYQQRGKQRQFDDDLYAKGFLLVARKPGLATTMFGTSELEAAVRGYRAEVKLPNAQRLTGQVTAPDGSPVANALVAAGSHAANMVIEGVNAVRTDAQGRYEFTDRQPLDGGAARKQRMQLDFYSAAADDDVVAQAERPAVGQDWEASRLIVSHPDYAVTRVDAGDIPGTADVTMLRPAAIVGRVVEHGTSAPAPDTLVRAYALPDLKLDADGRTVRTIDASSALSQGSHVATTRTDETGRYRFSNLPAGVYDVWAEPTRPEASAAPRFNRGHSSLLVAAGTEPVEAPDLAVGPGALVRVQLVDAATNQPVKLDGGGNALVAPQNVGGPRMQDQPQPRFSVAADGKFEVRLAPGTFRLAMFVYPGEQRPGAGGPAYQTSDDIHSVGATITVGHGDEADAQLKVWPMADINAMREATLAANKLRYDSDKKPEALRQSIATYTTLLERYPDSHNALLGRGSAHEKLGNYAEALADFERVLAAYPGDGNGMLCLARLLATCPEAEVRDGPRAVELATALVKLMDEQGWVRDAYLAILAAAQAEAGDFAAAVATQKRAVDMASDDNRAAMQERLRLFEAGKPYRRNVATVR
jgi:hypothetical protein